MRKLISKAKELTEAYVHLTKVKPNSKGEYPCIICGKNVTTPNKFENRQMKPRCWDHRFVGGNRRRPKKLF